MNSCVILIFLAIVLGSLVFFRRTRYPNVPTLRVSKQPGRLGELEDIQMFVTDAMKLLTVGWNKYSKHGLNYLIDAPLAKYLVVAPHYLDEIMKAAETTLGAVPAQNIMTQTKHTFSAAIANDGWHMVVPVRKNLVQHTVPSLPVLVEEGKLCLDEYIGTPRCGAPQLSGYLALKKNAFQLSFDVVVRTANRVLFGIELARNPTWQRVSIEYSVVMFHGADIIRNYPEVMKPWVLRYKTKVSETVKLARQCLAPVIQKRLNDEARMIAEGREAEWNETKPKDAIQWVLEAYPTGRKDMEDIVRRMLHITVAAVHTTTFTFMEILHCMAVMPQYLDELRQEAIGVLRQERGWSKQALTLLKKLDSFCNEASRLCPLAALKLARLALKDWEMSDGTKIPKGTLMFVNALPLSLDEEFVKNPEKFDPWRSYRLRQADKEGHKHQFVMASQLNLTWGLGKHACPGRFFAANEIKVLLVLVMLRYDFKSTNLPNGLEDVMKGRWYNVSRSPIDYAELGFKDRTMQIPEDVRPYIESAPSFAMKESKESGKDSSNQPMRLD